MGRKGDRRERELTNKLDDDGFAVIRAPASGSRTERELPDVLAADGDNTYAIESKASSGGKVYLDKQKVQGLDWFAKKFNAVPLAAFRWDRTEWLFLHTIDLYDTGGDTFRGSKERARERGYTYQDLLEGL